MKNYYNILQVNPKASKEIIEKAYSVLLEQYNPDIQKSEIEKMRCEQLIKDINEAYYVLSDVFLREQYDRELQAENIKNINQKYNNYSNYNSENFNNNYNNDSNINNGYNTNNNNETKNTIKNKINKKLKNDRNQRKNMANQENQEYEEEYEVGTFSALVALFRQIFQFRPDISKVKNAKKNDIIVLIISIIIVAIICVILWFIPFTRSFIKNLLFMH